MGNERILEVKNLVVHYLTARGPLPAVNDVSFSIEKGRIVGVVGESGSGKTTLALAILRQLPRLTRIHKGSVMFHGIDLVKLSEKEMNEIRWKKISYVPQTALNALNPTIKIIDHFIETGNAHGINDKKLIVEKAVEIMKMLNLEPERVLYGYPHELSGGMKQRVLIALSMIFEPELLILDEPTTALDLLTQRLILDLIKDLHRRTHMTVMFITHDIATIADIADDVIVMYAGKLMEKGDVFTVFKNPHHPYTKALMSSIPDLTGDINKMRSIPGSLPDLINPPSGCIFHPRCPYAFEKCKREEPPAVEIKPGHVVSCWLYSKQ